MKKQYFKTIGSTLIVCAFLLLAFGSDESSESENETTSELSESNETEEAEVSIEYKIGGIIVSDVYESNENGLKTYLKFEGSDGSGGMFGSLTLSNNASSCKYIYTYGIDGSEISAEFFQSDCGGSASDQTFTFNESSNTISCYINGQKFVFSSIF